jgi:polar amino acid transport system substrate-binding protein
MRNWSLIAIAVAIFGVLVYIVYTPARGPFRPDAAFINPKDEVDLPIVPNPKILTFASDPWPPYAGTAGAQREGYIIDILREIYEPLGYEVQYINQPWTRCLDDVRIGKITGLAGCDVHEAPNLIYPRESIGATSPTFFVLEGSTWRYTGLGALADIRLGAIQDYTYERNIDVYIRQYSGTDSIMLARGSDALKRLMDALKAGRIDAFIENRPVVYEVLESADPPVNEIVEAGSAPGLKLYVPFSPRIPESREYASIFDQQLVKLRQSGRLAEILTEYDLDDWLDDGD